MEGLAGVSHSPEPRGGVTAGRGGARSRAAGGARARRAA